jgi:hypothetical protein
VAKKEKFELKTGGHCFVHFFQDLHFVLFQIDSICHQLSQNTVAPIFILKGANQLAILIEVLHNKLMLKCVFN